MKMELELSVVTLNCWGIACVSKDRIPRMNAIAEELSSGKYDFVFLQEVWTTADYERIKDRTADVLPYSHYFFSGVIGAGLCIFSKSPIKGAFFHQWAVNGYIHKLQHGDWFGGKGIGMVEVNHRGLQINLYTAHLHAEYDRVNDEYLAHRVTQSFDTAKFISLTSKGTDVVIVGGDLNTEPGDIAYRVIVHSAHLRDAFFECIRPADSPEAMYTNETPWNSYSSRAMLKSNPYGKRIDYIMYKCGSNAAVTTMNCATPWPDRVPGKPFSYSDHEAVVVRLKVVKSLSVTTLPTTEDGNVEALLESIEICRAALSHLLYSKRYFAMLSIFLFLLLIFSCSFDSVGYISYLLPITRFAIVFMMIFCVFMGFIWNRMEVHGILSGKLAMELECSSVENCSFKDAQADDDRNSNDSNAFLHNNT